MLIRRKGKNLMYAFINHCIVFKIENPLIYISKLLSLFHCQLLPIMVEFRVKSTVSLQLGENSMMRSFIETPQFAKYHHTIAKYQLKKSLHFLIM